MNIKSPITNSDCMPQKKPRVLVIGTGGAISAKPLDGKLKYGEITEEELLNITPGIREKFDIETTNLFRMDSSDMQPKHWLTLSNYIYYKMNEFDGIVVTMGTDTLQYAAAAISFLIQKQNIPIVFTGSQVDSTQINTDAKSNLAQAITVAGESDIAETLIVFDGKIIRATRARKTNASEFEGFKSIGDYSIGKIQNFIEIYGTYKKRNKNKPVLYNNLESKVGTVKVYPGYDGNRLKHLVDYGALAIVLEGYGLGNIPLLDNNMKEGIAYANRKNVHLIISSAASLGKFWKHIYEAEIGTRFKDLRVIPVYDMIPETAYVKLMWVMSQTNDFSEVKKMMQRSYCGEITPIKKNHGKK